MFNGDCKPSKLNDFFKFVTFNESAAASFELAEPVYLKVNGFTNIKDPADRAEWVYHSIATAWKMYPDGYNKFVSVRLEGNPGHPVGIATLKTYLELVRRFIIDPHFEGIFLLYNAIALQLMVEF